MTPDAPVSVRGRISAGWACLVVAASMAVVVAIAYKLRLPPPSTGFWEDFIMLSVALCAAIGLVGFGVGPVRIVKHLGFLWGTTKPNLKQKAVVVGLVIALYAVVLFGLPTW